MELERPQGDFYWECELCGEKARDLSWDRGAWDPTAWEWARSHRRQHEEEDKVPPRMRFVRVWTDEDGTEHREVIQEGLRFHDLIGRWLPIGESLRAQKRWAQKMAQQMGKNGSSSNGHLTSVSANGWRPERWGPVLEAKVVPLTIYLPAQLLEYYAEFQIRFPEAFPDREPETLGRWVLFLAHYVMMSRPDVFIHGRILLEADRLAAMRRVADLRRLVNEGILTEDQFRAAVERLATYPDLVTMLLHGEQEATGGETEDGGDKD